MSYVQRLLTRFAAVLLLALVGSLAASSWFVLSAFERALIPEIEGKSVTLGNTLVTLIGQAQAQGVGLTQLVGVTDVLTQVQNDNAEIGLIAITNNEHKIVHQVGPAAAALEHYYFDADESDAARPMQLVAGHYLVSLPIDVDGRRLGHLHIGAKQAFVQGVLKESLLDILVVLVVAFFIAVEVTYFFARQSAVMQFATLMRAVVGGGKGQFDYAIAAPMKQSVGALAVKVDQLAVNLNTAYDGVLARFGSAWRERRGKGTQHLRAAADGLRALRTRYRFGAAGGDDGATLALLRAPLFLALLGDDFARAFLPMYSAQLYTPVAWLSTKFVLGLPIMLFMLIVALSQPLLGGWSERIGRRKALFAGVMIGVVAHVAAAFAYSIYDFLLWWSLAGLSWGIVFVSAQGYVLHHAQGKARVKGLAFFVGIIMISSVCGPSIGGILADGIGYRATLFFTGVLGCTSAWLIWFRLPDDSKTATATYKPTQFADIVRLLRNRRFVMFLLTGAMPAKIILIGFCFYLIPLYMPDIGSSAAMAGRLIMVYAIVMVIGIPLTARWSGNPAHRRLFVSAGLLVSGVAGVLPFVVPGVAGVIGLVILLGIGQSLSIAPQTAMVAPLCKDEIALLGEGPVLGVYRLIERIGNVFGPLVAALLLARVGFGMTFAVIGVFVLACGIIFFFTTLTPASAPVRKLSQ